MKGKELKLTQTPKDNANCKQNDKRPKKEENMKFDYNQYFKRQKRLRDKKIWTQYIFQIMNKTFTGE